MNIIIFGATGAQGQPQVREAQRQGHHVRVATRNPVRFAGPELKGVEAVTVDYDYPASLDAALKGIEAVAIQVPSFVDPMRLKMQCDNLVAAFKRSSVQLVVFNSAMWAPDAPCGEPVYDGVLQTEELIRSSGLPTIVFRPTVFMNNLLGPWVKPVIVKEGVYRYTHKPGLASDWICHEDLAKFMIAALKRLDLAGRKIYVGGPERLTTMQVVDILSETLGKKIGFEYQTPRVFAESFYDAWGFSSGIPRELYVGAFDSFYTFNNDAPQKPFQADVKAALELIPLQLTDMRTWAKAQDWSC